MLETTFVIFLLVLAFVSFIWHVNKIPRWITFTTRKFEEFEKSLKEDVSEYRCYTNNHPYVWGEADYWDLKGRIISSIEMNGYFTGNYPEISLKVDEKTKAIYVALGTDSFRWESLHHYDEWLESQREVAENIRKYKNRS